MTFFFPYHILLTQELFKKIKFMLNKFVTKGHVCVNAGTLHSTDFPSLPPSLSARVKNSSIFFIFLHRKVVNLENS